MPGRRQRPIKQVTLPRFGLNDKESPFKIHPMQAAALENIEVSESDAFSRLGYTQYGTTTGSGPIQNMHDHRESDSTEAHLRTRQNKIQKYNTATGVWDDMTLPISITANLKSSYVTLNDITVHANGTDNDLSFDGSTWTERSANPKADVQIVHENRVVKLKFSTGMVYYSDINDPLTYDALAFHRVDPNNAQRGVGLGRLNGQLVVFKERKKYVITALVGGAIIPLDGDISTVSHYSIAETGSSLIFLSQSGWFELRGTQTFLISDHIDMGNLNDNLLSKAHAIFYQNKYRCFVTENGVGYNNLEYVFHTDIRTPFAENPYAITRNRGLNGLCYVKTLRNGKETLYFGDSRPDSGSPSTSYSKVFRMFDGMSDAGTAIDAFWETGFDDERMPFYGKKYKRAFTRVITQTGLTYYVAHRFGLNDGWSEQALTFNVTSLSWVMDSGADITDWSEGYDWPFEGADVDFISLTNSGRPRTIQFRNRISSSAAQGRWIDQAYQYRLRDKFK